MNEDSPRTPDEVENGREYEAGKLVWLNELIQEMYDVAMGPNPRTVPDVALDVLQDLACAMVRRDPELGQLLVERLYERAEVRDREAMPGSGEPWQHEELARAVSRTLFRIHEPQADLQAEPMSDQQLPPSTIPPAQ